MSAVAWTNILYLRRCRITCRFKTIPKLFNGSLERITSLLSPLTSNRRRLCTRSPPRSNTRYQRPLNSKQFYIVCKMQQWVMSVRTADCYHSEWRKRRHDRLQRGFASVCFYIVLCKIYCVFLIYQTVHDYDYDMYMIKDLRELDYHFTNIALKWKWIFIV